MDYIVAAYRLYVEKVEGSTQCLEARINQAEVLLLREYPEIPDIPGRVPAAPVPLDMNRIQKIADYFEGIGTYEVEKSPTPKCEAFPQSLTIKNTENPAVDEFDVYASGIIVERREEFRPPMNLADLLADALSVKAVAVDIELFALDHDAAHSSVSGFQ